MQAVALIIFLAMDSNDPAVRNELQKLDGTWKVVAMEADGKKFAEKDVPFETVVFKQGKIDAERERKKVAAVMTFELDVSKSPKTIKVQEEGTKKKQLINGIYSLDGDKLRICLIHKGPAPSEFKIGPDNSGIILELKRKEAAAKDKDDDPMEGKPAKNGLDALMKAMESFRKELPPPQGLNEMNGLGVEDVDGNVNPDSHLAGIGKRLGAKTRADCMVLLTYLTDRDPKIRRIAVFAIEGVVNAYPSGLSSSDIEKLDSDRHLAMVKAFIAGIEKLPK